MMKSHLTSLLILCVIGIYSCSENKSQSEITDVVRYNSLGYKSKDPKVITIVAPAVEEVSIKNKSNDQDVLKAEISGPFSFNGTDLAYWKADFTALEKAGNYYIEAKELGRSADFPINENVYTEPYRTSMRALYLWRCGTEVSGVYKGDTFQHAACHLDDGWYDYTEFGSEHKDGVGGWHDAGDYGKYMTNAGITVANLLLAWDHFGDKIKDIELHLPEDSLNMPEFLKEIKWETDFLLKLEYPDGSGRVSHKLTRTNFSGFVKPENDTAKRYFTPWSSNAVANFAGTMAMASRAFKPFDSDYAQTCLEAADRSYEFLAGHPEYYRFEQKEFSTGGYQTHDRYARLWAAAEMWETTGNKKYLEDFEAQVQQFNAKVDLDWDWGNIKNLGIYTYLLSQREGKDEIIQNQIRAALITIADTIVANTQSDLFGRPFDEYYWGCNGTVARLAITLGVADSLTSDPSYHSAAQHIISHLFGRNYYGRSYVTGLGINPPMHPHSRRSASDDVEAPWPGYLVGGGHSATDWVDEEASYSHNEIALNWQAPVIYLLAWFAE